VAVVAPAHRDHFCRDLSLATDTLRASVVPSRAASSSSHWRKWVQFCNQLGIPPVVSQEIDNIDVVPFLQVFAQRYRTGELAPSRRPVRACTVEDVIRSISQTMASVGAQDPRLKLPGTS